MFPPGLLTYFLERLLWICVVSLGFGFAVALSISAYIDWKKNPVLTTIGTTGHPIEKVEFPAITICAQVNTLILIVFNFILKICLFKWNFLFNWYLLIVLYKKNTTIFPQFTFLLFEENQIYGRTKMRQISVHISETYSILMKR